MQKSCIIWFCYKRKDTQMSIKATRRTMISCYAQIINDYVLGYKIPELVKHEKIKARNWYIPLITCQLWDSNEN